MEQGVKVTIEGDGNERKTRNKQAVVLFIFEMSVTTKLASYLARVKANHLI